MLGNAHNLVKLKTMQTNLSRVRLVLQHQLNLLTGEVTEDMLEKRDGKFVIADRTEEI